MSTYHNITGSTGVTVTLVSAATEIDPIKNILLTNIHDSANANVSLFLQDNPPSGTATSTFTLIHVVPIPANTALLLDDAPLLSFNGNVYGLYIKVTGSDTVDVLINR